MSLKWRQQEWVTLVNKNISSTKKQMRYFYQSPKENKDN